MKLKEFNEKYPIGSKLTFKPRESDEYQREATTRSHSYLSSSGVLVVKIDGLLNGVNVDRLTPIT